jgi:hypothetical protein
MGESTYFFTVSNNNRLAELFAVTAHQFSCQSRRRVTSHAFVKSGCRRVRGPIN